MGKRWRRFIANSVGGLSYAIAAAETTTTLPLAAWLHRLRLSSSMAPDQNTSGRPAAFLPDSAARVPGIPTPWTVGPRAMSTYLVLEARERCDQRRVQC